MEHDKTSSEQAKHTKRELYEKQVEILNLFLARGAISRAQYDKSLHDLTVKMGYAEE